MKTRQEKAGSLLRSLAGSFIKLEIRSSALLTAARAEISPDLRCAKIFISVFPEEKENEIMELLKKKERKFRDFIKPKLKWKFLPAVSFEIDTGAKMERRIDELLKL
ncbi:MAG: ribosome-binding factor A [Candidatus Methanoperedens sp.]|nr:ribosome-binding factor A [Candidatus Methanoperedens sp.]